MTVTDTNFEAICAAIDAGEDSALPYLTDWLEEHGDPRAKEMRDIARLALSGSPDYTQTRDDNSWIAHPAEGVRNNYPTAHRLAWDVWLKLPGRGDGQWAGKKSSYPTRSAAFLALAEALSS